MSPTLEEQLKNELITRAWSDPEFKALALKNPGEALLELGVEPPTEFKVTVLADTPGRLHWVIPVESDEELLEADLEAVAGGMSGLGQVGEAFTTPPPKPRRLGHD